MFSLSFERSLCTLVSIGARRPIRELEGIAGSSVRCYSASNSTVRKKSDARRHHHRHHQHRHHHHHHHQQQHRGLRQQIRGIRSTGCPRVSAEDSTLLKPQNFGAVDFALKDEAQREEPIDQQPIKTLADLDGPKGWPIVGNFLMYLRKENQGRMHEVQAALHQRYGKMFREKWGSNWQCHVSDPRLIEEIYRHEGRYPNRPTMQSWVLYRHLQGLPCGLTTAQSKEWQFYRTEFGKRLFCPNAVKSMVGQFNEVTDDLMDKLEGTRGDASLLASQLPNIFYLFSLEAAGSFLFETRLGCLSSSIPERTQRFIDSILEMTSSSLHLIVGEKFHQWLNTRFWRRHEQSWDNMFEIGKQLIDEKVKAIEESKSRDGPYLSHLLANENLQMEQIHSNITELLMAASDTTANTLCFVLNLLATNPAKQNLVRDELNRIVSRGGQRLFVTRSQIDELKYLKAVVKETMRMYPVVTMNCRILEEDITLNGFKIPKKTLFVMNHYAASMDPEQFSEPEKFKPERWLRGDKKTEDGQKINPFASLPFGFGGRSCLGKHVANQELLITLTKILKKYEIHPMPGETFTPVLRTFLTPGSRVPILLKRLD